MFINLYLSQVINVNVLTDPWAPISCGRTSPQSNSNSTRNILLFLLDHLLRRSSKIILVRSLRYQIDGISELLDGSRKNVWFSSSWSLRSWCSASRWGSASNNSSGTKTSSVSSSTSSPAYSSAVPTSGGSEHECHHIVLVSSVPY